MAGYRRQKQRDGANVAVDWGARGGTVTKIITNASTTETTTAQVVYFRALASSEHGWKNFPIIGSAYKRIV